MNRTPIVILLLSLLLVIYGCPLERNGCTDPNALNYSPDAETDNGSCTYEFDIPDGYSMVRDFRVDFHKVFGGQGNNQDEMVSAMLTDNSGNSYFSLNTNDASANNNILIGKISGQGELLWAKEWDGGYDDLTPDPGGNGETGGPANSMAIDGEGMLYVIGKTAVVSQNNIHSMLILKIDPTSGNLIWEKKWTQNASAGVTAAADAQGYGLDASGPYLYLTGSSADNRIPVIAIDKTSGEIVFQRSIELEDGTSDKGFVITYMQGGYLFVAGRSGSQPMLLRLEYADTPNPEVSWRINLDIGYGSLINDMLAYEKDLYLSCNRRGVTTYYSILKLDEEGNQIWGKTYPGSSNDRNSPHCLYLDAYTIYVGGRIGIGSDEAGLMLELSPETGDLVNSSLFFTGSDPERSTEHRIKGISTNGFHIYVAGQVYGGNQNYDQFTGVWMTSDIILEDYATSLNQSAFWTTYFPADGKLSEADGNYSNASSSYILQDASEKSVTTTPDADFFLMKLTLY